MKFLSVIFLFLTSFSFAQLIPANRTTDWVNAGLRNKNIEPDSVINFLNAGADTSGLVDNSVLLHSIINGLNGQPAIVYFPSATYFFNKSILLKSNVILRGESSSNTLFKFDLTSQNDLIRIKGTKLSDTTSLAQNAQKDQNFITVLNASNFQKGDFINLVDNDANLVFSSWALKSTGQIVEIDSISGNQLFLNSTLRRDYSSQNASKITKLNMQKNIGIENIHIQRLDQTTEQTSNIDFEYAYNCWVKCIKSTNCNYAHITTNFSLNLEIFGSYFLDGFSYGSGGKAYGVMLQMGTCEALVRDNIFEHLRHSMILQAGSNGNVLAYNYSKDPFWTGVFLPANSAGDAVLHGNYPYLNLFEGNNVQNIVIDNSHGINGPFNTFFRNHAELYGIFMNTNPASSSQNFVGNVISNTGLALGNYTLEGSNHFEFGNNHKGNCVPSNTENVNQNTLFLTAIPAYYYDNNLWPPIGYPNALTPSTNEAKHRYQNAELTKCTEPEPINSIKKQASIEVKVFPNPSSDFIYIQSNQLLKSATLYDLNGRKIKTENINHQNHQLNLNMLSPGIYLLELIDENAARFTNRLVKME